MAGESLRQNPNLRTDLLPSDRHEGQHLRPRADIRRDDATVDNLRFVDVWRAGCEAQWRQQWWLGRTKWHTSAELCRGPFARRGAHCRGGGQRERGVLVLLARRVGLDAGRMGAVRVSQSAHKERTAADSGECLVHDVCEGRLYQNEKTNI